ncbi:MAG: ABC transporter ATP-binding protein, partial [Bellilinea sp.]
MAVTQTSMDYDLKNAVHPNRLIGLWRLMTGYHWRYLGANLSLGISALAKTSTYMLLRYFVDHHLIANDAVVSLWGIALGFVGLAVIEGSFSFTSGRLAAKSAEGIARRLRNYLFDHIQHLSFSYHSKTETGELIQRSTSDTDALRRFYSEQAIGMGRILFLFVINFVAILQLNVKLGLISVIVVPFIVVISLIFFRRISKLYESYQSQDAVVSTTLQENLSGIRVVKAFARQDYEIKKFDRENWEKFVRGRRLLQMHSFFWPVSDTICNIQIIGGYLVGALMAINGEISVGTYLAYAGLIVWIIFPMRNLGRLIVQASTGMVSYNRVMAIIKEDREPLAQGDYVPEKGLQGKIEFNHVNFAYEEGSQALEDITFTCQPGQVVALLGSTGSGKTTLVNLLPRFFEYTSGSILLDGI